MRKLRDLHEELDSVRMRGPFFEFSGYFMAFAAAAFMSLVFGLFFDRSIALPAFWLTVAFGVGMVVDAVRSTLTRR